MSPTRQGALPVGSTSEQIEPKVGDLRAPLRRGDLYSRTVVGKEHHHLRFGLVQRDAPRQQAQGTHYRQADERSREAQTTGAFLREHKMWSQRVVSYQHLPGTKVAVLSQQATARERLLRIDRTKTAGSIHNPETVALLKQQTEQRKGRRGDLHVLGRFCQE